MYLNLRKAKETVAYRGGVENFSIRNFSCFLNSLFHPDGM